MPTLYQRLGGEEAVLAAVNVFYGKVAADPVVAPFFETLDMDALVRKQVSFMTRAFGGPDAYAGRDLTRAHAGLVKRGLDDKHFDAIAGHLDATLRELGIADDLVQEVLGVVGSTRDQVLGRGGAVEHKK